MVLESTLSWMLTHFSTVKLSISDFSDFLHEQCLRVTIDVMNQPKATCFSQSQSSEGRNLETKLMQRPRRIAAYQPAFHGLLNPISYRESRITSPTVTLLTEPPPISHQLTK